MAVNGNAVISTLDTLIQTCKDRENGYRGAAAAVQDASLVALFRSYQGQSSRFATELEDEVRRLGGASRQEGNVAAWFQRGWRNLPATPTGDDMGAVIAACETGEDGAKKNYDRALQGSLPADVRAVVQRQATAIHEAHDRVRSLEVVHRAHQAY